MGLVVLAQNVDDSLVAYAGLGRGFGRMTRVVSSLSSTGGSASCNTVRKSLYLIEREEFVSHICVRVGDRVVGSVDGASKLHRTFESWLRSWRGILVITIRTRDHYVEVILSKLASCMYTCLPSYSCAAHNFLLWSQRLAHPRRTHLMLVKEVGFGQLVAFGLIDGSRS